MQLAALAAVALTLGSAGWQAYEYAHAQQGKVSVAPGRGGNAEQAADNDYGYFEAVTPPYATSSTPEEVAQLGPAVASQIMANFAVMQQEGSYTPEAAAAAGAEIAVAAAQTQVAHPIYDAADITTTADVTPARISRYQRDMAEALAPLSGNTRPEYEIFAYYVETGDDTYLAKLRKIAGNYRTAAGNGAAVVVPQGMQTLHIALLNSFQEFAAVLDALADNATDPITSTALLVSYNKAEDNLRAVSGAYTSFYASR